ncbi:rho guanine nucleotide exchange factor 28 isoform X1 [Conger conger]|uniref:rho guanine nucleotide exchange factor 28 isoform X1 n=1 Tax=Conger conger TaxID=82655 RepID=UPI002A5A31A7|nr:rho guanine nucleotide exchange factor 28 isoform X1 [Conger conger]
MELSRHQVPLYGQQKASAVLQNPEPAPEEARFYMLLEGSTLEHISVAESDDDARTLRFTVPSHNLAEVVSVTAYLYVAGRPISCLERSSLEYVLDDAQELAQHFISHAQCLTASSYEDLFRRFGLEDEATCRRLDENVTKAMVNLGYPTAWDVLGSQSGEAQPRETLLHLAVRLGLLSLTQLLLRHPEAVLALTLPNEEGKTPLQLAREASSQALLELLTHPPAPLAVPQASLAPVWADSSHTSWFCQDSETLTVQRGSDQNLEAKILHLRKHLRDDNLLRKKKSDEISGLHDEQEKEVSGEETNKDSPLDCGVEHALAESAFEEQLVPSLKEDEEATSFYSKKSQSASSSRHPGRSTWSAAGRLSAMISGRDHVYANSMLVDQVNDLDIKYSIAGVTADGTLTDSEGWDRVRERSSEPTPEAQEVRSGSHLSPLQAEKSPPPFSSHLPSPFPAELALERANRPPRTRTSSGATNPLQETCVLSPSLVALEVDSEEEDLLDKSPCSQPSTSPRSGCVLQASSGDERDSFDTSPDLSCSRTHSSSSYSHPPSTDSGDLGVRLRSYSYSSPKISLVRPRFTRDATISDLNEDGVYSSSGRSLLQALSLSKSLSLLNPVKQRAFSLPEAPQEKREISFRKRAQSAEDEGSVALADSLHHLTLSEFLKEMEEEEWDRYIIPSKAESEKCKVSRTFSFLKSRMSSTRNKNKGKGKDKEGKEKPVNAHHFAAGSGSSPTLCLVCDKPAMAKDLLQCSHCTMNVHKGCRDCATPCLKKLQDKYAVVTKNRAASLPQSSPAWDCPTPCSIPTSASLPVMTSRERRDQVCLPNPLSKSVPAVSERRMSESLEGDAEASVWRNRSQSEELLQVTESSPSTDSSINGDTVDGPLRSDLNADLLDYEAESWSLVVDHEFCRKQEKSVIKRQDVIYELMQTEMHHIQTLTIMAEIFRKGMKEELQLDHEAVEKMFPCLDELFHFHKSFFSAMKERRQSCTQEGSDNNFLINRIGDILVHQFSCDNAERMKQVYGDFCSHHIEAVNFFKELQQQNKKFQVFIKQQSNNLLVRRREIPECILLVTQRITKYPVLVERILQHSQEGTEEHADLSRALVLIRDGIAAVDLRVSEYEKEQKLLDVVNRMENKTFAKLKSGLTFRKQDLLSQARTLKHEGLLYWKTATGRLKDILALLLTDTLIFLQEKDQKYIFAAVDQKPPVISLQKLIVREVANEERGLFLISASAAGPEMYEVHTASKEERNSWMRLIREAVESCPEEEEQNANESEEERRAAEARAQKIHRVQETLHVQDQQICTRLEEKLKIYTELAGLSVKEEPLAQPRLLVKPNPDQAPQAMAILTAALREAENLTAALSSQSCPSSCVSLETLGESSSFSSIPASPTESSYLDTQSSSSTSLASDSETRDGEWMGTDSLILQSLTQLKQGEANSLNLKVVQSVQSLTQLLYSLQAAVTMQDSCFEVQRLLLQENERSPRPPCPRASVLQEQEKQRNLEKQREELAGVLRLQGRLRQERQRWERECGLRQREQSEQEGRLEHRERECQQEALRLRRERQELDGQRREYQQSLERLREGQRLVERERESLEAQQRLLQGWRHVRQRSLPVIMMAASQHQDSSHSQSAVSDEDGSIFINEAAFHTPRNNRHLRQRQKSESMAYPDTPSAHNSLNSLMACTEHERASCHQNHSRTGAVTFPPSENVSQSGRRRDWDPADNDVNMHSYNPEKWSVGAAVSGTGCYMGFPPSPVGSPLRPQPYISMETENGEDGGEENIVYL